MPRRSLAIALALPLLAIGLGIVRAELYRADAESFVFDVAGYDPRDLLRGRYLQFRLRVDEPIAVREPCEDLAGGCCLCLTRTTPGAPPRVERATCETARTECDGTLDTSYLRNQQRYYVPEDRARELEKLLIDGMRRQTAQAVMDLDGSGQARVRALRVDGEPLE